MHYTQPASKSSCIGAALVLAVFALAVAGTAIPAQAQTPTDVYNFKGGTGDVSGPIPYSLMAQGRDANLYSAAPAGGAHSNGGIFVVSPSGTESVLYSFLTSDGTTCQPGIMLGNDGNFYGDCYSGGSGGHGILYMLTPTGTFTILHAFTGIAPDGANPNGPPIQATDGNFYGTTTFGGANNLGTVYKLAGGTVTTLYSFKGSTDGSGPSAPLVQGTNGNLYGSSQFGGAHNDGIIFKISTAGKLTVLHAFKGTDGNRPIAALVQGADGKFYGSTYVGGANNEGVVFKMTSGGALTVIHSFLAATDGQGPEDAMVQATDGNFYGAANNNVGGISSIYKVTSKGVYSTLYLFNGAIGTGPASNLVQHTDGLLYGDTTSGSGTGQSNGIFYSFDIGAKAFARLVSASGNVGASIGIFGQGFSTATGVTFGGVAATTFTVLEDGYLTATVPVGAKTGSVVVLIPSGNLTSSVQFKVTPTITSFSPPNGPVGTPVMIRGTGLTQTTKVTFGGVKATMVTINSDSLVTAEVPTGAKTGKIIVTTKGGSATSATNFIVN
jgi:uncharacterized repeat protein (TIGR03803 family)